MSLRKSPTLTPARLEAHRQNAKKSTGPRAAQSKAPSRVNRLRTGVHSALYDDVMLTLFNAPPCAVDCVARAILTPEGAAHPLFIEMMEMACQSECEVAAQCLYRYARVGTQEKNSKNLRPKPECY